MDAMGIDIQIVFPQLLLTIGLHPYQDISTELIFAYTRWLTTAVLPAEPRLKVFLPLPFENPEACLRMVREFSDAPGVVGYMVTSQRAQSVHRASYFPLYREIEQSGMPLAFHAGPRANDVRKRTPFKVPERAPDRDAAAPPRPVGCLTVGPLAERSAQPGPAQRTYVREEYTHG